MSGCLKGEINMAIQSDNLAKARQSAADFRDILGAENFFLEMHDHGIEAQQKCNRVLPRLAQEFGLRPGRGQRRAFSRARAITRRTTSWSASAPARWCTDERRMRYVPELYFKSADEMRALFPDHPEAISNTLEIAERCNLELEFGVSKYPEYPVPEGKTREAYLRELCYKGLRERYRRARGNRRGTGQAARLRTGRAREDRVRQLFPDRLGLHPFREATRDSGRPGPRFGRRFAGRRMSSESRTSIRCSSVCIFERFLNPERVSPPDIDVDFCKERRGEVLEYVRQKYGDRRVSQIMTFDKMNAKSAVRDVGRVIGLSYGDADRIAKHDSSGTGAKHHARGLGGRENPDLRRRSRRNRRRGNCGITRPCWKASRAIPECMRPASSSATAIFRNTSRSAAIRRKRK